MVIPPDIHHSLTFFTFSSLSALLFQNYELKALHKDEWTTHYFYTAVTVVFEHLVHLGINNEDTIFFAIFLHASSR